MSGLNSLTVIELKQLLREQDLTVSGNKSELISRLEDFREGFLSIDDEETTSIVISNPKEIIEETSIGKKETFLPLMQWITKISIRLSRDTDMPEM